MIVRAVSRAAIIQVLVDPLLKHPYRSAPPPAAAAREQPLVRPRSWWRVAIAAVAAAGGPAGLLLLTACFGFDWLGTGERRRAAETKLRSLPFPIAHDRAWSVDEGRPRAIVDVTVRLKEALSDRDLERWWSTVRELVPQLTVVSGGTTIEMRAWPWRDDDALLLAHLLDGWGRRLHAAQGIAGVDVRWAKHTGPVVSI